VTTPAQDAPLVFPSVAFRPLLLLSISAVLGALAVLASALLGHVTFGWFFAGGLLLGLLNAVLVQRSVQAITADAHPLKRKMALNSATRLMIMSVIGLTIAYLFRPAGLGVVFGMALFQVLLVLTTMVPVVRAVRSPNNGAGSGSGGTVRSDD
jgi:ATP synthase I chain